MRDHTDLIEPKESAVGIVAPILEFDTSTQPHTETSYVPDLIPGEFQPLEECEEDWLQKLDLEAIVKEAESLMQAGGEQQHPELHVELLQEKCTLPPETPQACAMFQT